MSPIVLMIYLNWLPLQLEFTIPLSTTFPWSLPLNMELITLFVFKRSCCISHAFVVRVRKKKGYVTSVTSLPSSALFSDQLLSSIFHVEKC
ncbi:hypothetical protein TELCIR_09927 [Teladorsagia circumcincta]|uniref:Uncharacterized protein n=1 Tax=Teladorsagia circumcincta TaxID=45464 RepID=A0A2G9UDH9_TELCI|nr:hypothetical protein TELCIR_09927 [Teladorsagia circumcincta]